MIISSVECLAFDVLQNDGVYGSFELLPETARHVTVKVVNSETKKNEVIIEHESKGRWEFRASHIQGKIILLRS